MTDNENLKTTPLDSLHRELGGKMVPFAGYAMPVQYPAGILKEHAQTRTQAGLFDVSHMGQARMTGADPATAFETLVPGDIAGLGAGRMRYTMFTNEAGGILDDLMATNMGDHLFLVVNAACKEADFAHIESGLGDRARLEILTDRALLALQGPAAATVLARFAFAAATMPFMSAAEMDIGGVSCLVTRSGYTGEDGYEISIPAAEAEKIARLLLAEVEVAPVGLGARDSLRLEAGLCLYGSDIDTQTTPVEAGLTWAIGKRRREEGGFPGADVIIGQIRGGVSRKRVGILPEGRAPARAHTEITDADGSVIGEVTSGGFGPTIERPIAMGYVAVGSSLPGTRVNLVVRGKALPGAVVRMPFVEQRYYRG
ncbi:MAG: glycine cleavage system aminomethyltransferase GcvT [Rhodospirillales bacterium]|nr:glycine cleavage system aminomethyltransferase GcvT [Rhodospirillales bacterium]